MRSRLRISWRGKKEKAEEELRIPPSYEARGASLIGIVLSVGALMAALLSLVFGPREEAGALSSIASALIAGLGMLLFGGGGARAEDFAPFINELRNLRCWALFKQVGMAVAECDGWLVLLSKKGRICTLHVVSALGLLGERKRLVLSPISLRKSYSHAYSGDQAKLLYSSRMEGVEELEVWRGEVKVASPREKGLLLHGNTYGYTFKFKVKAGEEVLLKRAASIAGSVF